MKLGTRSLLPKHFHTKAENSHALKNIGLILADVEDATSGSRYHELKLYFAGVSQQCKFVAKGSQQIHEEFEALLCELLEIENQTREQSSKYTLTSRWVAGGALATFVVGGVLTGGLGFVLSGGAVAVAAIAGASVTTTGATVGLAGVSGR